MNNTVIYETENFTVCVPAQPHIPRADGGHLWVIAKNERYSNRCDLSPAQAVELMRLTMLTGEAMKAGLQSRGIPLVRINYQENGNWAHKANRLPVLHIHLYGRTERPKTQKWPEALILPAKETGFYEGFERLDDGDIAEIVGRMRRLESAGIYAPERWRLQGNTD